MNVFEAVKGNVTARQAAEAYGLTVHRNGMVVLYLSAQKYIVSGLTAGSVKG